MTILGAPLLTRYFSPDEFGVFATFGALAALLGTANALSYHVAIPLAPDNQEAVALAFLACAVSAALFILLLLLTVAVLGTGHSYSSRRGAGTGVVVAGSARRRHQCILRHG